MNFRIDAHVMSMLPIFHDKSSKDPYRQINKLIQICKINQIHNVPKNLMKMKLFPATIRDRTKDWFLKLGKEFTTWIEMKEEFLSKYYSVGKITSIRKVIYEFIQGLSETFHEAWARLRDLTREFPHYGVSNHELTQILYDGLGGSTFIRKFEDDAMN